MDDNIENIGIRFKKPKPDDNRMLTIVPKYSNKCLEHSYLIDEEADKVTCRNCDKVFNPMSVLADLARKESRWMVNLQDYQDKMKRLSEKKRTKCQHCGNFTKIKDK